MLPGLFDLDGHYSDKAGQEQALFAVFLYAECGGTSSCNVEFGLSEAARELFKDYGILTGFKLDWYF